MWIYRKLILIVTGFMNFGFILYLNSSVQEFRLRSPDQSDRSSNFSTSPYQCTKSVLNRTVLTANGTAPYGKIMSQIYSPLGYEVRPLATTCTNFTALLPLQRKSLKCENVFKSWILIQDRWLQRSLNNSPPERLSDGQRTEFSMKGSAILTYKYYNDIPEKLQKKMLLPWTELLLEKYKVRYAKGKFVFLPYGSQCAAVFHALKYFSPLDQTGIVIGSQSPWVEAMLLFYGARKIITSEYAPLQILHPQIHYIHPLTLSKDWSKHTNMDFVVSFSSIEHSGLGRYGDPLDPIGDLREVDKIACLLKPGGLLFIGLPTGQDRVIFNAHRIYGGIRWPMIAAGFEFVGAFYGHKPALRLDIPLVNITGIKHYLLVLQKL